MADLINLRQARKHKKRAEKQAEAAENRRKFGRTKERQVQDRAARAKSTRHLDGHRKDDA